MPRLSPTTRRRRIQQAISELETGSQRRYPAHLRSQIVDYARMRLNAASTHVEERIKGTCDQLIRKLHLELQPESR